MESGDANINTLLGKDWLKYTIFYEVFDNNVPDFKLRLNQWPQKGLSY
jgi:hypothetical protein